MDRPFLMPIEDVFSISGRGTVVTGRIERGHREGGRRGGDRRAQGRRPKTICTGVEMFRKLLDEGQAGDNVGVLLRGTKREEVERGQVLAKPGSITPHTKFECEVYVLTKEEGGRHTPFFKGYRPQFYFRTTDVTGAVELPEGDGDGDAGGQHQDGGGADQPRSRWKRACGLRSARVARPSAPASSQRSSSKHVTGRRHERAARMIKPTSKSVRFGDDVRPVAQLAERRSPKPQVGGSRPSWPASSAAVFGAYRTTLRAWKPK